MPSNFTETASWDAVPVLEPTDLVDATGGETAPDNKQARALTRRTKWLKDALAGIQLQTQVGTAYFNGAAGTTITHNLGSTTYNPVITPLKDDRGGAYPAFPDGEMGDWVVGNVTANAFTVYNSGAWRGPFRWSLAIGS